MDHPTRFQEQYKILPLKLIPITTGLLGQVSGWCRPVHIPQTPPYREARVVILWVSLLYVADSAGQQNWVFSCALLWDAATARPMSAFLLHVGLTNPFLSAWRQHFIFGLSPVICGTFSINCSLFWELHISIWLCHIVWSFTTDVFEIYPCSGNCSNGQIFIFITKWIIS